MATHVCANLRQGVPAKRMKDVRTSILLSDNHHVGRRPRVAAFRARGPIRLLSETRNAIQNGRTALRAKNVATRLTS